MLGSGKIEEIITIADQMNAEMIVFDRELSGPQVRNIEKLTQLKVFDRTGVILEIFSEHARSNQAKTQVEIARLEYMLPRLTGAWTHFQRQTGGGVRARGMGEKQIEVDRRRARERIGRLQRQLEQIRREKKVQSKARKHELKVALVGYTNSGKTTLMNALTKAQLKAKDELFATLDASIKVIDPRTRPKILLSDTVGFIRNLPHGLVESFKSTLDHVLEADLLLHVVDGSHDQFREQMETTEQVLDEIGAGHIPVMVVFNKIDRVADRFYGRILSGGYRNSIALSALNQQDVLRLREDIFGFFEQHMTKAKLRVGHGNQEALSTIFNSCLILESDYSNQDEIEFEVQAARSIIEKLSPYVVRSVSRNGVPVDSH
jgi:GTP-binding protein HflX